MKKYIQTFESFIYENQNGVEESNKKKSPFDVGKDFLQNMKNKKYKRLIDDIFWQGKTFDFKVDKLQDVVKQFNLFKDKEYVEKIGRACIFSYSNRQESDVSHRYTKQKIAAQLILNQILRDRPAYMKDYDKYDPSPENLALVEKSFVNLCIIYTGTNKGLYEIPSIYEYNRTNKNLNPS